MSLDFGDAMIRSLGATPTFLINDQVEIIGMASLEKFATIIDPLLAGAR